MVNLQERCDRSIHWTADIKPFLPLLMTLSMLVTSLWVQAAYYKCTNADGDVEFQSIPCASAFEYTTSSLETPLYTILIDCSPKFTKQVNSCLKLLEEKAHEEHPNSRVNIATVKPVVDVDRIVAIVTMYVATS